MGHTQVHSLNWFAHSSAVFGGLMVVTNTQTDHASLSVAVGCLSGVLLDDRTNS